MIEQYETKALQNAKNGFVMPLLAKKDNMITRMHGL